jgi:hypothetical protein
MSAPDGGQPPVPITRYEFGYTTTETGIPAAFSLAGVSPDVAAGIELGLQQVPTIADVTVVTVTEQKTDMTPPAWAAAAGGNEAG